MLPSGIKEARKEIDVAIAFADAKGRMVMHVPRALAVDARGRHPEVQMDWIDGRLVLRVDAAACTYPVLVDPSFETTMWEQKWPAMSPEARAGVALAFDGARGKILLLGGGAGFGPTSETWEWDGANWTQDFPATSPPARGFHAMAYDSARKVLTMFGGGTGTGHVADTWEWDGTNWSQKFPTVHPSARAASALADEVARGKTVLFGGVDDVGFLAETWEWDEEDASGCACRTRATSRSDHGYILASAILAIAGYAVRAARRRQKVRQSGCPASERHADGG